MVNLRNRLVLSHVLLVLFITLLLGITLIYVLETQVISVDLSVQLIRRANLLIEFAADNPAIWSDPSQAQAFVNRFWERTQAQLMLLNADGEILASSDFLKATKWLQDFNAMFSGVTKLLNVARDL